ncbi:MAG: sodium-dependent transporter [Elusimicrobiota bacterium]|jgi:NSS family neurotransmitter:Na+ symporter|nr:sodium-dependent transporter [Elusimicrobiota bacterium]
MKHKHKPHLRENFGSQFGLIMSVVGSAVGLGNVWRFSYILGINGGGAFLLIYILCVCFIGLPMLISELVIGRTSGLSTVSAFQKLAPNSFWWITGAVAVMSCVIIACYYPIVVSWSLGYVFESIFNWNSLTIDAGAAFNAFSSGWKSLFFASIAILITAIILFRGIIAGIEKYSKALMPLLAVIMIILVIRSLTLPGSAAGLYFLFYPDFSKLTVDGMLDALGHSFYSLSLGMGIIITYASYMKRDTNLAQAAVSVIILDTLAALFTGIAVFSIVFAMGLNPAQGAGLAFVTLPVAFTQMPLGQFFSALFFALISIAAITSMISIFQVPLAFLEDHFGFSKKKGLTIICAVVILFGIPSALSFGLLSNWTILGMDYFTFLDRLANNVFLPIASILGILFIIFKFGVAASTKEFLAGAKRKNKFLASLYGISIRFIAPIAIIIILLRAILM